jgi:SAM-dependent methyltransferase
MRTVLSSTAKSALPPNLVDLGAGEAICPGCGGFDHRHLRAPGDPAADRATFAYDLCLSCGTLHYAGPEIASADYYGADYYSQRPPRVNPLKRAVLDARNHLTAFAPSPFSSAVCTLSEHPVIPRLRPILGGALGRRFGRRDRWLDLGCGAGALLREMKAIGFVHLTGADPFMVEERTEPGLRLVRGDGFGLGERFDVVMLHHSLEHLSEPELALTRLHQLLTDGGVLLIRIPITGGYAWQTYGGEWADLDAPRHITLFSRTGFENAARRTGWSIRRVEYDGLPRNIYGSEARLMGRSEHAGDVRGLFDKDQMANWRRQAKALRKTGRSDQAAFYLVAA